MLGASSSAVTLPITCDPLIPQGLGAMVRSALPPTPERIARYVHRRVAVSLTFRRFLSPLDTDPSRRLPRGPAPGCADPWAAARAWRPSPVPCGMRLSPTGVRRPPGLRGTAPVPQGGTHVRTHGGAPPGPTPHEKAQSAAPTSRRMRFSVTSPLGRRGAQSPRQPAGHYGEWLNWVNVLEQPPARLRGGCARVRKPRPEVRHLTEKRSLDRGPR